MFRLCALTTTLLLTAALSSPALAQKKLVRVYVSDRAAMEKLPRGLDDTGRKPGEWIDFAVDEWDLKAIEATGLPIEIIHEDLDAFLLSVRGEYYSFAEIGSTLQTIAANYPSITQLTTISMSAEGRAIQCLEVSDNPGVAEGEPGVFFMGLHHAREWPTVNICLYMADKLTSEYASEPGIAEMVNGRRIWIVPCVNPDGYVYCHDQGHDWRRNRRYFPQFGTYGADLNRNYAGSCNGAPEGTWGSVADGRASHGSDTEVYCGPGPASEPETQAVRDFFLAHDIDAAITYHTHGELVLWPWGYDGSVTTPDDALLTSTGQQIAARITQQDGTGTYLPEQSADLYPTAGDTTDWAYGRLFYGYGKSTFVYTVEMCSQFQPPESALDQIVAENWDGAFYLMQQAETLRNSVTPIVLPPTINDYPTDPDGNYTVSWTQTNPGAGPDVFQLDELTGLNKNVDDAESGSGLWSMTDFSISTAQSHSATHSFAATNNDDVVASMTTVMPLPVEPGDTLSFWTWYDIETNWDYAFVEVSRDGRCYDVLDFLTGSSGGWVQKQYSLADYVGDSVFIRFRYCTDSYVLGSGIYVDDIQPVASFDDVTTLSNSIPDTYYQVTGRDPGEYWYRVRGHNSARGWGDFSPLSRTVVEEGGCCSCVGDLSDPCDDYVNATDFTIFANAYGSQSGDPNYNVCADLAPEGNPDGFINATDFTVFANHYLQPCP